tara:strand:+ start:2643 stop:2987 length:345 start_codon:yes stop_codon:yes gene_type:complete
MDREELVNNIIRRKLLKYSKQDFVDIDFIPLELSYEKWSNWDPTEYDTPCLIESIKYWSGAALPSGDKSNWTKLQKEIANECYKKELICYELLGVSMRSDLLRHGVKKFKKSIL